MSAFDDDDLFISWTVKALTITDVAYFVLSLSVILGIALFFDWLLDKYVSHVDLKDLGDEEISHIRKVIRVSDKDIKQGKRIYLTRRARAELRAVQAGVNVQELSRQNDKLKSEVEHLQELLNMAEVKAALLAKTENEALQRLSTSMAAVQNLRDEFEVEEVRRKMMQEQNHKLMFEMEICGAEIPERLRQLNVEIYPLENQRETNQGQNDDNKTSDKSQRKINVEIGLIEYLKRDIKGCESLIESQSEALNDTNRKQGEQERKIKQLADTIIAKEDLIQRLIEAAKRDQERLRTIIIEEEYGRIEAERALELERSGWERIEDEMESEN